jgi:hypothetical protein
MLAAMLPRGLARRLTALLAIAALVLGQALVAAHACAIVPAADAAAAPCHEPDAEKPAADSLCKAHCEAGTRTVDHPKPLVAPDLGAPIAVLRADFPAPPRAAPGATGWLARAGAPPPFLLHRRLRI